MGTSGSIAHTKKIVVWYYIMLSRDSKTLQAVYKQCVWDTELSGVSDNQWYANNG